MRSAGTYVGGGLSASDEQGFRFGRFHRSPGRFGTVRAQAVRCVRRPRALGPPRGGRARQSVPPWGSVGFRQAARRFGTNRAPHGQTARPTCAAYGARAALARSCAPALQRRAWPWRQTRRMERRRTDRERERALAEAGIPVWSTGPRGPARIYKNRTHEGPKKAPKCVACFPHSRAGQRVPLAYGVSLVLCSQHRDPRFIATRSGRDFLAAIGELYTGLGLTAARYGEALRRFVQQCTNPDPAPTPPPRLLRPCQAPTGRRGRLGPRRLVPGWTRRRTRQPPARPLRRPAARPTHRPRLVETTTLARPTPHTTTRHHPGSRLTPHSSRQSMRRG